MIIKSVLDKNYNIYGFIFENGEFKDILELNEQKFKNTQIEFKDNNIIELNTFKIKKLPMYIKNQNNYEKINNEIILLKKIVTNSELTGFLVNINNEELDLDINQFYNLSGWCNTLNYTIRKRNNLSYVVGKKGTKVKTMPIFNYKDGQTVSNLNKLKTSIDNKTILKKDNKLDIISFFNFLNKNNILLLKKIEDNYVQTKVSKKIDDKFIDLNIGELISPKLNFSDNKININIICKKMGNININGIFYPVFDITSKHLFLNGFNYLNEISLILKTEKKEEFFNFLKNFDSGLLIKENKDLKYLNKIKAFINDDNIELYDLNIKHLNIINEKLNLSIYDLYNHFVQLNEFKTILRYLNFVKKELNVDKKEKYGIYKKLKNNNLQELIDNNVDIYSGILKRVNENIKPQTENLSSEIIYSIKGFKTIPTALELKNKEKPKYISETLNDLIDDLENENDFNFKVKKCNKYIKYYNSKLDKITKDIWLYNMSNLSNGFYLIDSMFWQKIDDGKYICKNENCKNLNLTIKNIKERVV